MSLHPTSSACSNSQPASRTSPPLDGERSTGEDKPERRVPAPEIKTKKRKREIVDDMDVGGATSEESADEGADISTEGANSEPAIKRRRTTPVDTGTRQRISDAIKGGDLETLKKIIDDFPGVLNHKHDSSRATPLLEAVWWGQIGIVRGLLEKGADPNIHGIGYYADQIVDGSDELNEALLQRYKPKLNGLKNFFKDEAYVLGHSALSHAVSVGDMELIKLLISYKAEINNDEGRMTPIMSAVATECGDIVRYLLQNGADPMQVCTEGDLEDENALSMALRAESIEIFSEMLESLDDGKKMEAQKYAISRSAIHISVAHMKRLRELLPEVTGEILEIENSTGQSWLLELMLESQNFEMVRFLIDYGSVYKIRSEKDLSIAANVSNDKYLIELILKSIDSPNLREKFVSLCLYRNLYFSIPERVEIITCNQWLIEEMLVSPLFVAEEKINVGKKWVEWVESGDCLFHEAVSRQAYGVIDICLRKYGAAYLHIPGRKGKFPIELAAELNDKSLFLRFSNLLCNGNDNVIAVLWANIFERAAIEHQAAHIYEFLKSKLAQFGFDQRPIVQQKILDLRHWKSLEFFLDRDEISINDSIINMIKTAPAAERLMFNDILFKNPLPEKTLNILLPPFARFFLSGFHLTHSYSDKDFSLLIRNGCWKESSSAAQVLDAISSQVGKRNEKFVLGCIKLGRTYGMAGVIIERSIETQSMLSFIRHALLGSGRNPDGIAPQLSNFLAYWLPATDAWNWYLASESIYNNPQAPSAEFCLSMAIKSFLQLDDLHQTAKCRQDEWARKIVDELPALCLRCVNLKTEAVDKEALQGELIQRGIVAPNAIRLASLMQRAYPTAYARTIGILQSPALQLRQFSVQFATEITKLIDDDVDNEVNRRATADAMLMLAQPDYRRVNLPNGMSSEFEDQALAMLPDLVWWQLGAIFKCYGKSLAGESDAYARDYGPFLKFKDALLKDKYISNNVLQRVRADMESEKIGSGFRNDSFSFFATLDVWGSDE